MATLFEMVELRRDTKGELRTEIPPPKLASFPVTTRPLSVAVEASTRTPPPWPGATPPVIEKPVSSALEAPAIVTTLPAPSPAIVVVAGPSPTSSIPLPRKSTFPAYDPAATQICWPAAAASTAPWIVAWSAGTCRSQAWARPGATSRSSKDDRATERRTAARADVGRDMRISGS